MPSLCYVNESTRLRCLVLLGALGIVFLVENTKIVVIKNSFVQTYLLLPLLWGAIIWLVWWWPRARPAGRLKIRLLLYYLAAICAGFHILLQVAGGMVDGFGRSPYSFTPAGILLNIFYVGFMLGGMELSRAYLINSLARRRASLYLALGSLLFAFFNLPLNKLPAIKTGLELTKFTGSIFLPALAESVLASYFAYLGGPVPAMIYRGLLLAFHWFCPVLPNLQWTTTTLLGTFVPFFSLILVQRLYAAEAREVKRSSLEKENPWGWIVTSVVSVLLVWFAVGLFPWYPSVILSGSMEPLFKKGDVVLIQKISSTQEVKVGDIIQFRQGSVRITHRVIQIKETNGTKVYITKGDANNAPDADPVSPQQVVGRVVRVVPKMGWAALVIKTVTGGISPRGPEF